MNNIINRRRVLQGKANNYINDGLVFHLDGADATLSKWVDKVGGIEFDMTNISLDDNGGVVFNGNGYGRYPNDNNNINFPYSTCTIEVVINATSVAGLQLVFTTNVTDMVAFGFDSSKAIIAKSGSGNKANMYQSNSGFAVYSITPDTAYKNKTSMEVTGSDTWYSRTGGVFVGSRSTTENKFNGTIYQIRIYNRTLSFNEIIHNQEIDIRKYNIQ